MLTMQLGFCFLKALVDSIDTLQINGLLLQQEPIRHTDWLPDA